MELKIQIPWSFISLISSSSSVVIIYHLYLSRVPRILNLPASSGTTIAICSEYAVHRRNWGLVFGGYWFFVLSTRATSTDLSRSPSSPLSRAPPFIIKSCGQLLFKILLPNHVISWFVSLCLRISSVGHFNLMLHHRLPEFNVSCLPLDLVSGRLFVRPAQQSGWEVELMHRGSHLPVIELHTNLGLLSFRSLAVGCTVRVSKY